MQIKHRTILSLMGIIVGLFLGSATAYSQETGTTTSSDDVVRASKVELELDGERIDIYKVDGWVIAKAPKGSVALLRSAGDGAAQIDVRYTPGVSSSQKDNHIKTFHTHLKAKGLKQSSTTVKAIKSDVFPEVVETVYDLTSKGKSYQLVVWHVHRKNAVWMFTFFKPKDLVDEESLQNLIIQIKVSK